MSAAIGDITGHRFGALTAVEWMGRGTRNRWRCACDCGRTTEATASNLKLGQVKSCGCLRTTRVDLEARFWRLVDKNGPLHPALGTRCWLWTGALDANGYGRIGRGGRDGQTVLAHRASYEIANGNCSAHVVMHKCDNPPCVNPDHLAAGTQLDNIADMRRKGRGRGNDKSVGAANGNAKLSDADRDFIRSAVKGGSTYTALARRFGVTRQAIRYVCVAGIR